MSDLHCPARLTLAARAEGLDLGSARPAAVYASAGGAALAGRLGTPYDVLSGTLPGALDEVADLHRGEDVLVLLAPEELAQLPAKGGTGGPVLVAIDADGWSFEH